MRNKVKGIKDLKSLLKDLEPHVKNVESLYRGRDIPNFKQRPREIWANWLLVVVGNFSHGPNTFTFTEDPSGDSDGVIVERATMIGWRTEHVFIPKHKAEDGSGTDLFVEAVEYKAKKGAPYAQGKMLVIFSDGVGRWLPARVAREIVGNHHFDNVWAIGLDSADGDGYVYSVVCLDEVPPQIFRVEIDFKKHEWSVSTS